MKKGIVWIVSLLLSVSVGAKPVEIVGQIPIFIGDETETDLRQSRVVLVQNVQLSPEAQAVLGERVQEIIDDASDEEFLLTTGLPAKVDLGMNKTPVLNQGVHGTCVTFAVTAALDALLAKGDYISQLCSLELGAYLQNKKQIPYSGWDGSFGKIVLNQLEQYGIIPMNHQRSKGCAGVKFYPVDNEKNQGKPMSVSEYSANALTIDDQMTWESLVDIDDVFTVNHNPAQVLPAIKKSLNDGHRLTFGVLLDVELHHAGAMGKYAKPFDSWMLTPEIIRHAKQGRVNGGHEMIIIGYDDTALIMDAFGHASKGMLILRNSWGSNSGNRGNFYMSYDYFKALSDEVQIIKPKV
ncbi:C1 family peptidase [Legionella erythra]|uniref:Cysteine protease n=1 Tax=Legionella erythra TaxID=448 RepID=A0A0W0TFJ2_LEGER|nr:C1 family peptidase [Legionella erythra]KTC94372.1 cysteine protease [Legionella erythra]